METSGLLGLKDAKWRSDLMLRERDWGEWDLCSQQERRENFGYERRRRRESLFWAPPGGESLAQVVQRVDSFLMFVNRRFSGGKVFITCHGELMWAFRLRFERLTQLQYREDSQLPVDSLFAPLSRDRHAASVVSLHALRLPMGLVTFRGGQLATTPPFRGLNEWSTARAGSAISSHVQQPELVDARPRAETSSEGLPGRLFELCSARAVTRFASADECGICAEIADGVLQPLPASHVNREIDAICRMSPRSTSPVSPQAGTSPTGRSVSCRLRCALTRGISRERDQACTPTRGHL